MSHMPQKKKHKRKHKKEKDGQLADIAGTLRDTSILFQQSSLFIYKIIISDQILVSKSCFSLLWVYFRADNASDHDHKKVKKGKKTDEERKKRKKEKKKKKEKEKEEKSEDFPVVILSSVGAR